MREYVKCMHRELVVSKAERAGGVRMRVQAYLNIHRKCWSVVALEGEQKGRVISHTKYVSIKDARLVVQEGGRQRVLKEKKKNVHAFVRGQLVSLNPPGVAYDDDGIRIGKAGDVETGQEYVYEGDLGPPESNMTRVRYSPYHNCTFMAESAAGYDLPVNSSPFVRMSPGGRASALDPKYFTGTTEIQFSGESLEAREEGEAA